MNLQICAPYEPCVYNCPFCIARTHPQHNHQFDNLWVRDHDLYYNRLAKALDVCDPDCVVITGECDPTQNLAWVYDVIRIVRQNSTAAIELQTHNLSLDKRTCPGDIDVLAYSITNAREYLSSWRCYKHPFAKNRAVLILTKELDFLNKDNFSTMGFDQITFKALNQTENEPINKWIEKNNIADINNFYEIMNSRNGSSVSIRVDTNCQQAAGRYYVFRSDGLVYNSWETNEPRGPVKF
jgi:wyosine [tRNA(Phe)-imidazoG37] synthetase (radical SAM superfamily)